MVVSEYKLFDRRKCSLTLVYISLKPKAFIKSKLCEKRLVFEVVVIFCLTEKLLLLCFLKTGSILSVVPLMYGRNCEYLLISIVLFLFCFIIVC